MVAASCRAKGKMNAAEYREILEDNRIQSTRELPIGRRFLFKQDTKHQSYCSKTTRLMFFSGQIKAKTSIQWRICQVAQGLGTGQPFSSPATELEQFCKEDWNKITAFKCASLIETHPQLFYIIHF